MWSLPCVHERGRLVCTRELCMCTMQQTYQPLRDLATAGRPPLASCVRPCDCDPGMHMHTTAYAYTDPIAIASRTRSPPPPHTHEGKDEPLVPICARPCHCDSPSDGTRAHAALALAVSIRKPRPGQGALRSCARGRQRKPWQCRTREARVKWGYSPQGPRQYNPHYPTKPKNRAEPSRAEQRRAQQSRVEQ